MTVAALAAGTLVAVQSGTSAIPPEPDDIFDDFDDGDISDWGFFGGNEAGGGGGPASDRPQAGSGYFSTGWGGNGSASGFYGGTFKNLPDEGQISLPPDPWLNVWVLNQSDATVDEYTLEITIREDLDGDGWTDTVDDSFRYDTSFAAADFDDEWRLVSAPVSSFGDQFTGGDGTFDGAVDEMVFVIAGVGGGIGSTVEVDFDQISFTSGGPEVPASGEVIDDFENGLPSGSASPNGEPLGFYTFQGAGSSVGILTEATPPAPVLPALGAANSVLTMNVDSGSFAGFIHAFENPALDTWVTQDWSTSEGISFWMYGQGSGTQMFIDILDNRNPGSTSDDAERWTVAFPDDFAGWKLLEFPFASFTRKEIGNGAPNDGLGLFEMHGYALGALGTGVPQTYYLDDVSLYGIAEPPALAVNFSQQNTFIEEGTTGEVGVRLNRPFGPDDPAQVSIDFATERSNATPFEEFTPTSGTLTFVNGGPSELSFPVETFDDTKFEGDEQIVIRLTNPVDADRGALFQGSVLIQDNDPFDPDLLDDFEQGAFLWETQGGASIETVRSESDTPDARPGQDAVENIGRATVPVGVDIAVKGRVCNKGNGVVPVQLLSTATFDATTVDHTTVMLGDASETHVDKKTGEPRRHVADVNGDGLDDLVFHFRFRETGLSCDPEVLPLSGSTFDGQPITTGGSDAALVRDFPIGQDWTGTESVSFWYLGSGDGDEVTFTLKDNRAPDPGPGGWDLAWSDEFDDPAGAPPNPANWAYEIGDTTPDGKNGWGNEELQYYTDDPSNAATDGNGNLVITLDEADGSQECYYGPCEFESARLITQNKAEFAYGRIESRLQVPTGGDGLWPAFWSLGTDITYNPWPGAGEIDVMEYVSRIPNEIFGTIHGPGYNGGGSFSGIYDFGERVDLGYHTFTVEWEPELITWYVDGVKYHEARPSDVPGPWVFEKPFFLLLNFAIGGNFGGAIDPANTYPQEYLVDYVRVYQGPDTAERFEASFTDDVAGWSEVTIPVTDLVRSDDQPTNAPDDGLGLNDVWGYGLAFPNGTASGEAGVDFVRRIPVPPPTELVVTNLDNDGPGSLREALALIADGGTITFDPGLAGGTLALTSGQLTIDSSVTIDASGAAPVTISAGSASRVLQVEPGTVVAISDVVIRDGVAAPQGGGILNYGELSLDRVVVTDNTENSAGPASFDLGGGGIYNGDGSVLNLTDSTVSDNSTASQPGGGIFGFFNSTINITNSAIIGNVAGDVAGGLRTLGDVNIIGSTISGNTSTAWHGGGIFATDGTVTIVDTNIVDNVAPAGTAGGLMVATFGAPVLVTLQNSVVTGNVDYGCQVEGDPVDAVLTSLGGNTFSDGSCNPIASDVILP
jgi:beta-glucanase (GH16 family)